MYTVIRNYPNNSALFDFLEKQTSAVEELIRSVPGFVTYCLTRSSDGGGFSVSVFEDQKGAEESTARARDWIRENAPEAAVGSPPQIMEGETFLQFSR